jgi:hypothetical protein
MYIKGFNSTLLFCFPFFFMQRLAHFTIQSHFFAISGSWPACPHPRPAKALRPSPYLAKSPFYPHLCPESRKDVSYSMPCLSITSPPCPSPLPPLTPDPYPASSSLDSASLACPPITVCYLQLHFLHRTHCYV